MTNQERIIRNAYEAATAAGGVKYGEGGKAIAKLFREELTALDVTTLMEMIAIMANGLADIEERA